ncbi:MAG: hypothetical protein MR398_07425 [Oscillospiraceae bacterium]|nr:hypothetical protein [Oscillospiraceae bacterium]
MEDKLLRLAKSANDLHLEEIEKVYEILKIICPIRSVFSYLYDLVKDKLYEFINSAKLNVSALNIKKKTIKKVFEDVRSEDVKVGRNIEMICKHAADYAFLLSEFENVMNTKNNMFNEYSIEEKVTQALDKFDSTDYEKYKKYANITDEDPFLHQHAYIGGEHIKGINGFGVIIMAMREGEKITLAKIKDLWLAITGQSYTWNSYNESKIRKCIKNTLDAYAEESDDDIINYTKKADNIISQIKNCKSIAEFENSNFLKDEKLKKIIIKLGGFTKVWNYAKECPELLEYIFTSYEKQKSAFSLIRETYKGDNEHDYGNVIDRLENEYNNKFYGILDKFMELALKEGYKAGTSLALETLQEAIGITLGKGFIIGGAGMLYGAITAGISITLETSGAGKWADNALDFCYYYQNQDVYRDAYEKYRQIILSGKYTDDDVVKFKMSFEMMKQNLLKEYNCYLEMCTDPAEKSKIKKKIAEINYMQAPKI